MSEFDVSDEYYKIAWWQRPFTEEGLIAKGEAYIAATGLGLDSSLTALDLGECMHHRVEPKIRLIAAGKGKPSSSRRREAVTIAGRLRVALDGIKKYKEKYPDWLTDGNPLDVSLDESALIEQINYWENLKPSGTYTDIVRALAELFRQAFKTDPTISISEYSGADGAFWRFVKLAFDNADTPISAHTVHAAVYRKEP